jgi:phage terminase small subunit
MNMSKNDESQQGKGARYPQIVWDLLHSIWSSAENISFPKAIEVAATRTTLKLPSKGAVSTYATRNGWKKGDKVGADTEPLVAEGRSVRPRANNSRPKQPTIEPAWEVDGLIEGLTPREARFVEEFLIDRVGVAAARRAGYSESSARSEAYSLLNRPAVRKAIQISEKAMMDRLHITQDMVLKYWWDIATCDPNEISQYRRDNCRHCWGNAHGYQWIDDEEYRAAMVRYQRDEDKAKTVGRKFHREPPDGAGGFGFVKSREPNPSCPQCSGDGFGYVHIHDTRRLSTAARRLYAGVKEGKEGIEAKIHDQMKAMDNVARFIGMFKERVEIDLTVTTTAELDEIYERKMAEMRARAAQFAGRGERLRLVKKEPGG